jgi:glycosyltransferase involved in cell wall biosynthesis
MLVPEMIAGKSALVKHLWIALQERRSLGRASFIHVTSEEEANGVRRLGLDLVPLAIIGNGVDRPERRPDTSAVERVWAGIAEGHRVAFLGRLDWTKGLDLTIDAILAHPTAGIVIAGPDQIGLRARLEPKIGQRGRFVGPLGEDDKWALLAGADVLLAPSVKESFGIAVAESLAIGTPVICTLGVGAASIVRRIDNTCVVERRADAIARALAALLDDAPRRATFGVRAKAIMDGEFTWTVVAAQMESLLQSAVGAARRTAAC